MKPLAKLLYQTYTTYFGTAFPAHYYGMPNGKVYLVFSRFYSADIGQSGIEFVFAEHKEFRYDYNSGTLLRISKNKRKVPVFAETVNKPDPKIKVVKVKRNLNSYGEAVRLLNNQAEEMEYVAS
jgi:hypothetical protein